MICAKNGLLVYLAEYDCNIISDAYKLGELLILRTGQMRYNEAHAPFVINHIEQWFDKDRNYGTMIVLPNNWEGEL